MTFAPMDAVRRDWSYALRALRRTPGFTLAAVLILGLGIGMATAMLSVFNSALLQKLPVRDQDRLVVLWPVKDGTEVPLDFAEYEKFRDNSHTLQGLAAFAHWGAIESSLSDGDEPLVLRQALVTGNFFAVLGASPVLGRFLEPADQPEDAPHVIVISFAAWHRQFGGDRAVIGKQLKGRPSGWTYTIVGVAPPGLDYPIGADYWAPVWPGMPYVDMVGRLKAGISPAAARSELATIVKRYQEQKGDPRQLDAFVRGLPAVIYGDVRPAVLVMTAAAGLLLLIACTNVGNLLLLRAAGRAREIAVRRALGASRPDILRQCIAESAVLGLLGGSVGLGVASSLLRLFAAVAPRDLPRVDVIRLGGVPLVVGILVSLTTVILTGLAPLMSTGREEVGSSLLRLDSRAGTESLGRRRVRQALVVGQVALALVVLAGASLLTRSLIRLERLPLGLTADQLTIIQLWPPITRDTSFAPQAALLGRILPAIRALPGVVGVSPVLAEPFTGANTFAAALEADGHAAVPGESSTMVSVDAVGADFFRTFDLPLLRGRGFGDGDRAGLPRVAVVTKTIARWFWAGQDPIGKRFRFLGIPGERGALTVVGVSDDVHYREFRASTPMVFVPYQQELFWQGTLGVRTRGEPGPLFRTIRETIRKIDPDVFFWRAQPMNDILATPLARPRMDALLLVGFGGAALVLAAIGLYAVIASTVRQRTRELGIRMALGAAPGRVERQVLSEAVVLVGVGGAIGLVIALMGSRLLRAVLFEVSPTDPIALLGAGAVLLAAGLFAGYLPAKRATKIDPAQALRAD